MFVVKSSSLVFPIGKENWLREKSQNELPFITLTIHQEKQNENNHLKIRQFIPHLLVVLHNRLVNRPRGVRCIGVSIEGRIDLIRGTHASFCCAVCAMARISFTFAILHSFNGFCFGTLAAFYYHCFF